jgi:hypothetical protein
MKLSPEQQTRFNALVVRAKIMGKPGKPGKKVENLMRDYVQRGHPVNHNNFRDDIDSWMDEADKELDALCR